MSEKIDILLKAIGSKSPKGLSYQEGAEWMQALTKVLLFILDTSEKPEKKTNDAS